MRDVVDELQAEELNRVHGAMDYCDERERMLVQNQWMRLFCLACLVVAGIMAGLTVKLWRQASDRRLVILSSSANGTFESVGYTDVNGYRPTDAEIEHFIGFVFVPDHYSRVRYTIAKDYTDSLKFLSEDEQKAEIAEQNRTRWIEAFQKSADPEIRIEVKKVRFGNSSAAPYRVSVDFEKHFVQDGIERPETTETWTADVAYTLEPDRQKDHDLVPVNPLGISIGTIREYQGFK